MIMIIKLHTNASLHLKSKCGQLKHKLKGEHSGEDHIENIQDIRVDLRLSIKFHRERHSVDHN